MLVRKLGAHCAFVAGSRGLCANYLLTDSIQASTFHSLRRIKMKTEKMMTMMAPRLILGSKTYKKTGMRQIVWTSKLLAGNVILILRVQARGCFRNAIFVIITELYERHSRCAKYSLMSACPCVGSLCSSVAFASPLLGRRHKSIQSPAWRASCLNHTSPAGPKSGGGAATNICNR